MKASMYFNYTSRSLFRGGQRTLLAIFCVAVGVMAIVALQLVGLMINNAFTGNVRDANGGDIAIRSQQPFTKDDLKHFDAWKKDGSITDYTPVITSQASTGAQASQRQTFSMRIIDAAHYPAATVTPPTFSSPAHGSLSALVKNDGVVVTQPFIDQYKKKLGDSLDITISGGTRGQSGRVIHTKIAGIVTETGVLAQSGSVVLLSVNDYIASAPKAAVTYDTVDVTAEKSKIDAAVKEIQQQFPIATTQTAADVLKQQQSVIDNIRKFLEIAGLLALLIGGVGIVNTMQVLLSRRRTEIAMLKTTGYRRFDLYLLFGLEAGLLGLAGGLLGAAAATGISYLVRNLVEQNFGLNVPFVLDWFTIIGGMVIGVSTALIFGLLPIVQAANIRPLNVIRELPEGRGISSIALTTILMIVLSILFCVLSIVILNGDIRLGTISVYGIFIFLGLLSLVLSLLIVLVSKLPVPERFSFWQILLVVVVAGIAYALYRVAPPYGLLFMGFALLGLFVMFVPRTLKASTKMALRNLARQRARTTTTMLALFVGIFTIGLILALGQNLRTQVNEVISHTLNYNVYSITSNDDTKKLNNLLPRLAGLSTYQEHTLASTVPAAVKGKPFATYVNGSKSAQVRRQLLSLTNGVEGYDVGNNQFPSLNFIAITQGRNLNLDDAGTNNVLVRSSLAQLNGVQLKVGDKITLVGIDQVSIKTVTVVGFYDQKTLGANFEPILGTTDTVKALTPAGLDQTVFYMKIDPNKLNGAVDQIGQTVPKAFLLNLASLTDFINQLLNDILLTLTTIASLTLLAGIIIIANAVALAMLERRRELGILKSVGYTSRTILGEVMLENGLVGGLGALVAMVLASLITWLLGKFAFNASFSVDTPIVLGLVLGSVVLSMFIAVCVAWSAVRVRPLEVLRYE
ncbi:ABC transporter permease [Dictyobacter kobayashii]|uniref:Glycosyl transferase family 1 n=1 Tax=Dictyobacter kobayashii TaxID=2014872 RepID=A0A402AEW3_9CHLR|nr:FtsX-like permease family protein [Dictyobacter kobayashii]GCE17641.1 glycosyl transferase family 1 [Dictyobacter kobayashii]